MHNLIATKSDHSPIYLHIIIKHVHRVKQKHFRFKNAWLKETSCLSMVQSS